jgi:hypothetical protein
MANRVTANDVFPLAPTAAVDDVFGSAAGAAIDDVFTGLFPEHRIDAFTGELVGVYWRSWGDDALSFDQITNAGLIFNELE